MSAFVVRDATINRIVNWVKHDSRNSAYWTNQLRKLGYKAPGYNCNDEVEVDWAEKLAHDLFKLNCRAVEARYGKGEAGKFRALDFRYNWIESANSVQSLKSLHCLLYQCSEGDIPNDPLYQWLEQVSYHMAYTIVSRLPEYEKAEWG